MRAGFQDYRRQTLDLHTVSPDGQIIGCASFLEAVKACCTENNVNDTPKTIADAEAQSVQSTSQSVGVPLLTLVLMPPCRANEQSRRAFDASVGRSIVREGSLSEGRHAGQRSESKIDVYSNGEIARDRQLF